MIPDTCRTGWRRYRRLLDIHGLRRINRTDVIGIDINRPGSIGHDSQASQCTKYCQSRPSGATASVVTIPSVVIPTIRVRRCCLQGERNNDSRYEFVHDRFQTPPNQTVPLFSIGSSIPKPASWVVFHTFVEIASRQVLQAPDGEGRHVSNQNLDLQWHDFLMTTPVTEPTRGTRVDLSPVCLRSAVIHDRPPLGCEGELST